MQAGSKVAIVRVAGSLGLSSCFLLRFIGLGPFALE